MHQGPNNTQTYPFGLSNQRVQVCSSGCLLMKSGSGEVSGSVIATKSLIARTLRGGMLCVDSGLRLGG
jgi:hypothetical protein